MASHRFELIPLALQRGYVEIVNTFLNGQVSGPQATALPSCFKEVL